MQNILLVGRWHGVTRAQEAGLRDCLDSFPLARLVFVVTGADQGNTKRHPLNLTERREIVRRLGKTFGRRFETHGVADTVDSSKWVEHLAQVVHRESRGRTNITPDNTILMTGNADVSKRFFEAGFQVIMPLVKGALPPDIISEIRKDGDWRSIANNGTIAVFEEYALPKRIKALFHDVLLTDDGELDTGRDFELYIRGMEAGLALKISDIAPHVRGGRIVDKGCGSGALLIHLSKLFPHSELVGMDLSRALLHAADGQHYPNQNVSVVMGNIIAQRFPDGSLSCVIFSSVMHEVYSYNGYDRNQVREALRNTRKELMLGGRIIIRDGVAPQDKTVWMRLDAEMESRFIRFANDFKGKSAQPGVRYSKREIGDTTWFVLGLHDANEFLSKKDYLENWHIEVNEEFGVFTLPEWKKELEDAGFNVLTARAYVNSWVRENRYENKVWLHGDAGDKPGDALDFPDTTVVLVGEAV